MEIISNPTQVEIKKAAQALKNGHLVAFPTETVYGLGADATNEKAVSRVYSVKSRPTDHPLIVHISSINQLDKWAIDIPDYAIKLAKEFWPGPLTLILKRGNLAKNFVTGGQNNVGVRVPHHSTTLEMLKQFEQIGGKGIAAPSANKFGAVSPTTAQAVLEDIGACCASDDLVLDGGQCAVGIESTIIDCTNYPPRILRPGAITTEMVESITGFIDSTYDTPGEVRASGMLASHYSPRAKVELNKIAAAGEGLIAMAHIPTPIGVIRLAAPTSVEQYANQLYSALKLGDHKKLHKIIVIQPGGDGLAESIRDRTRRSANN